jgi:hypothetical protein
MKTMTVDGIAKAQYTQKLPVITSGPLQSSDGTANTAARKVPGRKIIVMTAIVFMEPLSRRAASACRFEIKAKIYPHDVSQNCQPNSAEKITRQTLTVLDCAFTRLSRSFAATLRFQTLFIFKCKDCIIDV